MNLNAGDLLCIKVHYNMAVWESSWSKAPKYDPQMPPLKKLYKKFIYYAIYMGIDCVWEKYHVLLNNKLYTFWIAGHDGGLYTFTKLEA